MICDRQLTASCDFSDDRITKNRICSEFDGIDGYLTDILFLGGCLSGKNIPGVTNVGDLTNIELHDSLTSEPEV